MLLLKCRWLRDVKQHAIFNSERRVGESELFLKSLEEGSKGFIERCNFHCFVP